MFQRILGEHWYEANIVLTKSARARPSRRTWLTSKLHMLLHWISLISNRHCLSNYVIETVDKISPLLWHFVWLHSLCLSNVIKLRLFRSALTKVVACCLMAPSDPLKQCWLTISDVLWHPPDGNSLEMLKTSIVDMSLKTSNLRFHPHLSGAMN